MALLRRSDQSSLKARWALKDEVVLAGCVAFRVGACSLGCEEKAFRTWPGQQSLLGITWFLKT